MENPYAWGPVEKTIAKAQEDWRASVEQGAYGPSEVSFIANALRAAGLLNNDVPAPRAAAPKPGPRVKRTPKPGPPTPRNPGVGKARPPKPGPFRPSN